MDAPTRQRSEATLAELSTQFRPEQVAKAAAVLAQWAAPGRCDPADQTAVVDGEPAAQARQQDTRSSAQRNHDALNTECEI